MIGNRTLTGEQSRAAGGAWLAVLAAGVVFFLAQSQAGALSATCPGQDATVTPENVAAAEDSLHCLVNVYRRDNDLGSLARDSRLDQAARWHSEDMVKRGYFGHRAPAPAPYGPDHWDRANAAGFPADDTDTSENIAAIYPAGTPLDLFQEWRSSPDHNRNMLTAKWVTSGFGIVRGWPGDPGPATFGEGATATGLFATSPGASGGGTADCDKAKRRLKRAKRRLAEAREAKAKAEARKRNASSRRELRRATRKLVKKKRALRKARAQKKKAKKRYEKCVDGL